MNKLLLLILLTSCGVRASGTTTHRVEGEATVRVVVDVSLCDSLKNEDKLECIKTLLEIMKAASESGQPPAIGGI